MGRFCLKYSKKDGFQIVQRDNNFSDLILVMVIMIVATIVQILFISILQTLIPADMTFDTLKELIYEHLKDLK